MHGFAITDATTAELRECAETINRLLGEGKLRARIDRITPLAGLRRRIVCSKSRRRKSMARSSSCLEHRLRCRQIGDSVQQIVCFPRSSSILSGA